LRRGGLTGTVLALALGALACGDSSSSPRLALLVVVDQLPADRLDPALPGGLGRLAREGRLFSDAAHAHAVTDTCPGHVAAATGRHPGPAGVPGNQWIDVESGREVYCVEDEDPEARVLGGSVGRSPRALEATALGDWLRAARPGARVFAVSGKDRAAIALGGQHPDAAWWLDRSEVFGFTTSAWYRSDLPDWVRRFEAAATGGADMARRREAVERLRGTPALDERTLAFALALVEAEGLGADGVPDLLAISLSALDAIGHEHGPDSEEWRSALARTDAALGRFLAALEGRVGAGGLLVALTADHGVLPLVERPGVARCPLPGGRADPRALFDGVEAQLDAELGAGAVSRGRWLLHSGDAGVVNRARARAEGVKPDLVVAAARRAFAEHPAIARVWTAVELEDDEDQDPYALLYRHSFHPRRSGDLLLQPREGCLLDGDRHGTNHGSPYLYDRAVPLVFFGPGVRRGCVSGPAAPVDLAPTLATLLGVDPPAGLDGRVLPLR
jgi:predicted AlkP superfamily pyrophosphatase or phosphodiesterase